MFLCSDASHLWPLTSITPPKRSPYFECPSSGKPSLSPQPLSCLPADALRSLGCTFYSRWVTTRSSSCSPGSVPSVLRVHSGGSVNADERTRASRAAELLRGLLGLERHLFDHRYGLSLLQPSKAASTREGPSPLCDTPPPDTPHPPGSHLSCGHTLRGLSPAQAASLPQFPSRPSERRSRVVPEGLRRPHRPQRPPFPSRPPSRCAHTAPSWLNLALKFQTGSPFLRAPARVLGPEQFRGAFTTV